MELMNFVIAISLIYASNKHNYLKPTILLTTHALIDSQQDFAKGSILDAMIDRLLFSLLLQLLTASTAAINLLFQQKFCKLVYNFSANCAE